MVCVRRIIATRCDGLKILRSEPESLVHNLTPVSLAPGIESVPLGGPLPKSTALMGIPGTNTQQPKQRAGESTAATARTYLPPCVMAGFRRALESGLNGGKIGICSVQTAIPGQRSPLFDTQRRGSAHVGFVARTLISGTSTAWNPSTS